MSSTNENEVVAGTAYGDWITTHGGNDTINSGGGDDWVSSGAGNDTVNAGAGNDTVDGGDGDDFIDAGSGNDVVDGGAGNDFIEAGIGNDTVDGGAGDDTIEGGSGLDIIDGGDGNDVLLGEAGDDYIDGSDGNDELAGGAGHDYLFGGLGDDGLDTGDGIDRAYGGGGDDYLVGTTGGSGDYLAGDGFDSLEAWSQYGATTTDVGNDVIVAGAGADTLYGDNANSTTALVGGNDVLIGGAGNDQLFGEGGDDVLDGETGRDTLTGGAGADRFTFEADLVSSDSTVSASDYIVDFVQGQDKIDLTRLLGAADLAWGGTTPTALGVWFTQSGGNTFVHADVGGTAAAELRIQVCGLYTLTENDFLGLIDTTPPPVATNDSGAVAEDATLQASGNVLTNDSALSSLSVTAVQFGSTAGTVGTGLAGAYGALVLNSDGTYVYTLGNGAANVQGLRAGQTVQEVFSYTATNAEGTTSGTLTITITGANDVPTIAATATASIAEDAVANGTAVGADADTGAVLTYGATQGTNGAVTIDEDTGAWTYAPTPNFNGTDTFTITVTDDQGATATQAVTVNVAAVGDAAVIGGQTTGSVNEDGTLAATGALAISDPDAGEAAFQPQADTAGGYGTFSVNAAGVWSYALANSSAAVQSLDSGETVSDQFTVTSVDGTQQLVTISIAGANDAPVAGNNTISGLVEAGGVANGEPGVSSSSVINVLANDSDVDGEPLTTVRARHNADAGFTAVGAAPTAIAGLYGTLFIQADGTSSYTLDNSRAATQALTENQAASDVFVYEVSDGDAVGTATISVAVTGNNDSPHAMALSGSAVGRNIPDIAVGSLSAQDVDSNSHTFSILPGGNGNQFVIDGNLLKVGASGITAPAGTTLQVNLRATDAFGGFVDRTFAIAVEDLPQFPLTAGVDNVTMPAGGGYVVGTALTVNAGDRLVGGAGDDTLLLYGPGTFSLNSLAELSGFEEIQLINFVTGATNVTLPSNLNIAITSTGDNKTITLGSNSNTAITFSGNSNTFVMGGGVGTTTITATGSNNTYRLGAGTEIINGSNLGSDIFQIIATNAFTVGDSLDGRGSSDTLQFTGLATGTTFDLRGLDQENIESLSYNVTNGRLLIDQQSLTNVTSLSGNAGASFVTDEATLNLVGRSVSTNVRVQSTNATGTVFTVSSSAVAFQIAGGPGQDTLNAPTVLLTTEQREQIFLSASIETITDSSGTYTSPFAGSTVVQLTTGGDPVTLPAAGGFVVGTSTTLTATDALTGGAGNDVLFLHGAGTFNLGAVASFVNFDEIRLLNQSVSNALLLPNGLNIEINAEGNGNTSYRLGTGAETINGSTGSDTFQVTAAGAFTAADALNGGSGFDTLQFTTLPAGTVFDLRGLTYQSVESISFNIANGALLIDQANLINVSSISGSTTAAIVTAESTLNLLGRSVSGVSIQSSNPGGTTFSVNDFNTIYQVAGGIGADTVNASTMVLTADQREQVLMAGSIDTLIDATGTYSPPFAGANVIRLTTGTDALTLPSGGGSFVTTSATLNSADSLTGGAGTDVLRLYGGGSFRVDLLPTFTGIEEIRLVNFAPVTSTVLLPANLTAGVASVGNNQQFTFGNNSNVTVAVNGNSNLFIMGSGSTTTITASSASSGNTYRLGSGTEIIDGGGGSDTFQVLATNAFTAADSLDGRGSFDQLLFTSLPAGTMLDIRGLDQTNIEQLSYNVGNGTLLIDQASLAGVQAISGSTGAVFVTAEASLDLVNRSVTTVRIQSSNPTGTVFTTNSASTALQVSGGPGEDTLHLQGSSFTAEQRDFIFVTTSVDVIRDSSGLYGNSTGNTLTGTNAGETIVGGSGGDVLIGGLGSDALTGGLGGDEFVFQALNEAPDTILDFGAGDDLLVINAAAFGGGLVAGTPLHGGQFVANSSPTATSGQGQFLYDTDSGQLLWDADGTGAGAPTLIATLTGAPTLTTADFELV